MDETGTVNTESLANFDDNSVVAYENTTVQQHIGIEGINDELLRVHGRYPGNKAEGVSLLIMDIATLFTTNIRENEKLDKSKEIIDDLEADMG